jgi:hypothetical protein
MANILERYINNLFERELGLGKAIAPYVPIPAIPFAPNVPSPFDFDTRRRTSFPVYGRSPTTPTPDLDIFDEPDGSEAPPEITIETITGDLSSYINQPTTPQSFVDKQLGLEVSKELASGQDRVTGMGGALTQFASLTGLSASMIDAIGEKSKQNLESIVANAALGIPGYGIGRVNNQTVGISPGGRISGTVPTNLTTEQMNQIQDVLGGKSGALGPAMQEYSVAGGRLDMGKPQTQAMLDFEKTVIDAKGLSIEQKAGLLGYDRLTNPFERSRMTQNYYTMTPLQEILENKQKTAENREGMSSTSGSMSMGLETDIDAQQSQKNPMGINIGIDMANITGPTTTVDSQGYDLGGGYGGPTGGPSGLDVSSEVSSGGYSDNEAGDNQDGGFGGGGWTAYGGKIGNSDKGFVSKTQTIKGVGLIKPEETFVETDMVRDRFEFDAADGDYVVNGPASKENEGEIIGLVNSAINELKKEGVDIRVGNPKIKDKNKVPLIVASSEIYIPKVVAEKIGYPILDKINESGKAEVTRLKNELGNNSPDDDRQEAYEGMRVRNPQQGFLFRRPELNLTNPNTDKPQEDAFVPGISDEPVEMTLDQQRFFNDYEFGDIKKAIKKTEIQGFEKNPFIFTGVKAKKGKSSSAFGPMQITKSLIEDFESRSPDYKTLSNEEKKYLQALKLQGEDKINKELYGVLKRGPKEMRRDVDAKKVYGKKAQGLKPYGKGTIDPEMHKKYYDKIADVILLHKLKDHKTIEDALASYGEGAGYGEKVLNDLLDIIQIK